MAISKMGRPPLSKNESTVHKSISMKLSQYLFLKEYGFGNASLGVQRLVNEKRKQLELVKRALPWVGE